MGHRIGGRLQGAVNFDYHRRACNEQEMYQ